MPLYRIFPRPMYLSKLERALTEEELKIINKYNIKYKYIQNDVNKAIVIKSISRFFTLSPYCV